MTVLEQLFSLEGKNIIVTGGAQGIGKIVATRLAEIGANLALFDMQEEKVAATCLLYPSTGCRWTRSTSIWNI